MTGKKNRAAEQFIMLPRSLLGSNAWRDLTINARRFLDFLMIEHIRHGGRENGYLLAPRRQLIAFGIGAHYVSKAIDEVDRLGLVHCKRGIGRRPSYYSLTWLTVKGADAPTDRWRSYRPVASAEEHPLGMSAVLHSYECCSALTKPVADAEQHSQGPKSSSAKQHSPSIEGSYHGGAGNSSGEGRDAVADGHSAAEPGSDVAPDGCLPRHKPTIIDIPIKRVNGEAAPDGDVHPEPTAGRSRP